MMKKFKPLCLTGLLVAGISTASAAHIHPGMMEDFESGSTNGWTNGKRVETHNPPTVQSDGGNKYLEVKSFGKPKKGAEPHNQRLVVFNNSYEYDGGDISYVSPWEGDYSGIKAITAKAMATSDTEDTLYLRVGFSDDNTYWASGTTAELPTDGNWHTVKFNLDPADFVEQDGTEVDFKEVLKNATGFRILSNSQPGYYGGDAIAAVLGLDDITAMGEHTEVAPVPLPGTVWLMISGVMGLAGMSAKKRCST